jgi:hypothetical protein
MNKNQGYKHRVQTYLTDDKRSKLDALMTAHELSEAAALRFIVSEYFEYQEIIRKLKNS